MTIWKQPFNFRLGDAMDIAVPRVIDEKVISAHERGLLDDAYHFLRHLLPHFLIEDRGKNHRLKHEALVLKVSALPPRQCKVTPGGHPREAIDVARGRRSIPVTSAGETPI
jgi:hypothetical protein